MEQLITDLIGWLETAPPYMIYGILMFFAYVENVIPPIPGDLFIAMGGYLIAEKMILAAPALGLTTLSSTIGFMTVYWVGFHFGDRLEAREKGAMIAGFIPSGKYYRGKRWVQKWGLGVVLVNRMLAGTRSVIALTSGMAEMNRIQAIAASVVSSLAWNSVLLALGFFIHGNWQKIGQILQIHGQVVIFLMLVAVGIWLFVRWFRKRGTEV